MRPQTVAGVALFAVACGGEPQRVDSTQRSMSVPVPSSGSSGAPGQSDREMFEFPKRATTDPSRIGARTHATLGAYVVDATGRSLYSFSDDAEGQSACLTNCATVWPPVVVETLPTALDASIDMRKVTLTSRPDGSRQLTFHGRPLYYAESDLKPGDIWGHSAMSFGGRFTLLSPAGKPLPAPR